MRALKRLSLLYAGMFQAHKSGGSESRCFCFTQSHSLRIQWKPKKKKVNTKTISFIYQARSLNGQAELFEWFDVFSFTSQLCLITTCGRQVLCWLFVSFNCASESGANSSHVGRIWLLFEFIRSNLTLTGENRH